MHKHQVAFLQEPVPQLTSPQHLASWTSATALATAPTERSQPSNGDTVNPHTAAGRLYSVGFSIVFVILIASYTANLAAQVCFAIAGALTGMLQPRARATRTIRFKP